MLLKKGAMFGLDARIALAIFGALSVISGAALYSAIEQSKVIKEVTRASEVAKAYEQYLLDVGPLEKWGSLYLKMAKLVEDTSNGWKGPYLSYDVVASDGDEKYLDHPDYLYYAMRLFKNDDFGAVGSGVACDDTDPCFVWLQIRYVPLSLSKAIDEYVDGVESLDTGSVRIRADSSDYSVYYKIGPLVE